MRRLLTVALGLVLTAGCDSSGADVNAAPGRFTATLSGVLDRAIEGEATFTIGPCGSAFSFESRDGTVYVSSDCDEARGRAGRGRYRVEEGLRAGVYQAAFLSALDGSAYRGVDGSIELVSVEEERVTGLFSVEAKPVGSDGSVIASAPTLRLVGEFDAARLLGGTD